MSVPRLSLGGGRVRCHGLEPDPGVRGGPATTASGQRLRTGTGLRVSHVLVALDGSPLAECVLPFAEHAVAATGARLTLMRVVEAPARTDHVIDALDWEMLRVAAHAYLTRIAGELAGRGTAASVELAQGRPAEQILSWIREHGVDLILMSTHGEGGLSGWSLSSTTDKVLRRANASLLIVPAYAEGDRVTDPARIRRILVPLDTSPRAECVLPFAVQLARHHEAEIVLSHVVLEPEMPRHAPLSLEDRTLAERLTARNKEEAERYLDGLRERLAGPSTRVRTQLRVASRCTKALRALADDEDVDLVLLSAHGHTADPDEPQGDVPARLVHAVGRPVLIVQDMPAAAATPASRAAEEHPGH